MKTSQSLHQRATGLVAFLILAFTLALPQTASGQDPSAQQKMTLMTEALRARDGGNLQEAKAKLEELLRIAPDDQRVQQLLNSVNRQIATGGVIVAPQASSNFQPTVAPAQTASPEAEALVNLRRAIKSRDEGNLDAAKMRLEAILADDPDNEAVQRLLAGVNTDLERRMAGQPPVYGLGAGASTRPVTTEDSEEYMSEVDRMLQREFRAQQAEIEVAERAMDDARKLMDVERFAEADAVLVNALNALSVSASTADTIDSIEGMRAEIFFDDAREALTRNDLVTAEAALKAYVDANGENAFSEAFAGEIEAVRMDPNRQDPEIVSPDFVVETDRVDNLLVKARAQILYGDYEGASKTLREIEAVSPTNPTAKALQIEIMDELSDTSYLDRSKTRSEMLREVARAWQRPQIFDIDRGQDVVVTETPLKEKLRSIRVPKIEFNDAPLSRVINTLSEYTVTYDPEVDAESKGVNMVLMEQAGASTPVTITLRDFTMDQILDFVTETVGFSWDVEKGAVVIRRASQIDVLETEFFPISSATLIRLTGDTGEGGGGGGGGGFVDPFAPAGASGGGGGGSSSTGKEEMLIGFFERAGIPFQSVEGASLAFDGAQIIVTQSGRNLERMRTILRRYDQPKQVEIEAKFLEVQQGNLDQVGFNWSVNYNDGDVVYSSGNRTLASAFDLESAESAIEVTGSPTALATGVTTQAGGFATIGNQVTTSGIDRQFPFQAPSLPNSIDLGATSAATLTSQIGILSDFDVNLVVDALSREQGSDLLSAPRLTVLSGRTAEIVVAQELRYPENYGDTEAEVPSGDNAGTSVAITPGTPQDFTVRNVGVEMEVTPTVEENENISLKLKPQVTEFEGFVQYGGPAIAIAGTTVVSAPSGFFQPVFSTRTVRTEVTVFDGATVVIGGLTREEAKTIKDKIPFFGDLPLIGRLFRSEGETFQKRNLLIFVTANLVSPGGSPARQDLRDIKANSLFQNPIVVTPTGGVSRRASDLN